MSTKNNHRGQISWLTKMSLCTLTFSATFFLIIGFSLPFWVKIIRIVDQKLGLGQNIYVGLWGSNQCNTTRNDEGLPIEANCTYINGGLLQHMYWFPVVQFLASLGLMTSVLSTIITFYGTLRNLLQWWKVSIPLLLTTDLGNVSALLIFRNIYILKDGTTEIYNSMSVMFLGFGIGFTSISIAFNSWLLDKYVGAARSSYTFK